MPRWRAHIALTVTLASTGCGLVLGLEDHGLDDDAADAGADRALSEGAPPREAGDRPDGGRDGSITPESVNRIFITSTVFPSAVFGSVIAADTQCQAHAADAGLDGTFIALMSSSVAGLGERLTGARGWVRVDGRPVADTATQLVSGNLWYPIALDEHGSTPSSGPFVATGATSDGGTAYTCGDWGGADGGQYSCGYWPDAWSNFLVGGMCGCSVSPRLYCLETAKNVIVPPPPREPGRVAFVSRATIPSSGGVAAADAVCAAEASGKLPGTFQALLATSTASAASRFDTSPTSATWVRPDGIPVFASAADLVTNKILIPIMLAADGASLAIPGAYAWAGAPTPGDLGASGGASTCGDWMGAGTNALAASIGSIHARYSGTPGWFGNYSGVPCSSVNRVFCFQE